MPGRQVPFIENKIYHIVSKSIAKFKIFRSIRDYQRMKDILKYYQFKSPKIRYSLYLRSKNKSFENLKYKDEKLVEIISYCLMPTHIHLVLKQVAENGISTFMAKILNSYTRYFNTKYKRKGPLWEGRFKNIEVETTEQLYHLTRYIHLNPVSVYLVEKPEDWEFSSYKEFINEINEEGRICEFEKFMDISKEIYKEFVLSRIDYQREFECIKRLFLE
jgi:putative transposase